MLREKIKSEIVNAGLKSIYDKSLSVGEQAHKANKKALKAFDIDDSFVKGQKILKNLISFIDGWIDALEEVSKGAKKLGKRTSILLRPGNEQAG